MSHGKTSSRRGSCLRLFRGNRTLQEVCDLCSTEDWVCYPATIEQIEKGRHVPGTAVLYRIACGLGVTLNHLVAEPLLLPPGMEAAAEKTKRKRTAVA